LASRKLIDRKLWRLSDGAAGITALDECVVARRCLPVDQPELREPIIEDWLTGPQNLLSSDSPRLSPST
jgi:hypothetical protein